MSIDGTTFVLEIVNFLVLVWILQRFLYEPVRAAIARRQQTIEGRLAEARAAEERARALEERYEGRLAEWKQEREKRLEALRAELEAERTRRGEELEVDLVRERQRRALLDANRDREARREVEEQALAEASRFAARFFARVATPALEDSLVDATVDDLRALPEEERRRLRDGLAACAAKVRVTSARPLSAERRGALESAIRELVGEPATIEFDDDENLVAGLEVVAGASVLRANVRDELAFFAEGARGDA